MRNSSFLLAGGIATLATVCLSNSAVANNCQLKKNVLTETGSEIGALIKDTFAAYADDDVAIFEGAGGALEHIAKILSGPDFGEAYTRLDTDLYNIGSILYDLPINLNINTLLSQLYTDADQGRRLNSQHKLLAQGSDADTSSEAAVKSAYATDVMSTRLDKNDCANDGGTNWKKVLAQPPHDGTAWDWRRSAPYLMRAIDLRLGVIDAMDPAWRSDKVFDKELYNHHVTDPSQKGHGNALEDMSHKIMGGIQCYPTKPPQAAGNVQACDDLFTSCSSNPSVYMVCAETYTGISSEQTYQGALSWDQTTQQVAEIKSGLIEQLPLFEMRSMLDKLLFFVSHTRDLTEILRRIPAADSPGHNLCIDLQGPYYTISGAPAVLQPCDATKAAQTWVYNRSTGEIYNPALNTCLGMARYKHYVEVPPIPGTSVVSATCDESNWQRWTYDPDTQVLSNPFGTVLDVKWGQFVPGQAVWVWDRNDTPAQHWRADPSPSRSPLALN